MCALERLDREAASRCCDDGLVEHVLKDDCSSSVVSDIMFSSKGSCQEWLGALPSVQVERYKVGTRPTCAVWGLNVSAWLSLWLDRSIGLSYTRSWSSLEQQQGSHADPSDTASNGRKPPASMEVAMLMQQDWQYGTIAHEEIPILVKFPYIRKQAG